MATPGFGFSVGDLIAGIQLVNRAANALQKSTGSAAQYQQTVVQLNGLDAALRHAQKLESGRGHTPTTQHIKLCAHACHIPLARFRSRISKYEQFFDSASGSTAPRIQRHLRKLQWAVSVEEELSKLQTSLLPQFSTINLFLQLQQSEDATQYQKAILDAIHQVQIQINSIGDKSQQSNALGVQQDTAIACMSQVPDYVARTDAVDSVLRQTHASRDLFLQNAARQEAFLRSLSGASLPPPSYCVPAASALASSPAPSFRKAQDASESEVPADVETDKALAPHRQTTSLHYEANTLLAELLWFLCCMLSQVRLLLRSISAVPKGPTLLLQDNIQLEDALGRVLSLPYEHFRYWPVIFARLQCEFKGLPGEGKVKQNQFLLINMNMGGNRVLTAKKWETAVFPGARLAMSIMIKSSQAIQDCPRCSSPLSSKAAWLTCTNCGIVYRMLDLQRRKMQRSTTLSSSRLDDDIMDAVDYLGDYDEDVAFTQAEAEEVHSFRRIHVLRDTNRGNNPANQGDPPVGHLLSETMILPVPSTVNETVTTLSTQSSSYAGQVPIHAESAANTHKPPPGARWTKIRRPLVSPEALRRKGYRFEERSGHVIVFEVLPRDVIQNLANFTQLLREHPERPHQRLDPTPPFPDEIIGIGKPPVLTREVGYRNVCGCCGVWCASLDELAAHRVLSPDSHTYQEARARTSEQYTPRRDDTSASSNQWSLHKYSPLDDRPSRLPNTISAGTSSLCLSPQFSSFAADRNAMSYASFRGMGYLQQQNVEKIEAKPAGEYRSSLCLSSQSSNFAADRNATSSESFKRTGFLQ